MTKISILRISRPVYNIIADGNISDNELGEGRFIPALILDAEARSEVDDLIEIHVGLTGDAKSQWSRPFSLFSAKSLTLEITFQKPMEIRFAINFDLKTQFSLVDGIIQSRAVYIQRGIPGDKVSEGRKVLIEIPETGFDSYWESLLNRIIKDKIRKSGRSKKEVNIIVNEYIKSIRSLWHMRRD